MTERFKQEDVLTAQTKALHPSETRIFGSSAIDPVYSLVARPSQEIKCALQEAISKLAPLDPGHYLYDPSQYHFTVMGDFPLTTGQEMLIQLCEGMLKKHLLIPHYKGLHMKNGSAFAAVYFDDGALGGFRKELRDIDKSAHDYSIYLDGLDGIAWLNVMRFTHHFLPELQQAVLSHKDTLFGTDPSPRFELYQTSSLVLAPDHSELIATF
jgi:hypothetical protein